MESKAYTANLLGDFKHMQYSLILDQSLLASLCATVLQLCLSLKANVKLISMFFCLSVNLGSIISCILLEFS